jgi:hypothetical protein
LSPTTLTSVRYSDFSLVSAISASFSSSTFICTCQRLLAPFWWTGGHEHIAEDAEQDQSQINRSRNCFRD